MKKINWKDIGIRCLKTLIYRIDVLEKKIVTMNNNLDLALKKDDEDKSKKWDKLVEYIFYAIL